MCSDGLWSEVQDEELAEILAEHPPEHACRQLLERAIARDCTDNVSIQVVRVLDVSASEEQRGARNGWLSSIFQRRNQA
jgi:serine/threonine protein phosphatase PrpC